jgi:hypothetical protein
LLYVDKLLLFFCEDITNGCLAQPLMDVYLNVLGEHSFETDVEKQWKPSLILRLYIERLCQQSKPAVHGMIYADTRWGVLLYMSCWIVFFLFQLLDFAY